MTRAARRTSKGLIFSGTNRMRRPVRPFTVERKRGSRTGPALREPEDAPQPTLSFEPFPSPEPPTPTFDAARAAAEALFSGGARKPDVQGRILPSLIEPPPILPEPEPERPTNRRGRKPGSRNKPKVLSGAQPTLTPPAAAFEEPLAAESIFAEVDPPPAPAAAAAPAKPLVLRRRGRLARAELARGDRWRARLPRFAR